MSFCDLCSGLSIAKLYPPNIYHHADNLAALEASAESCSLCKMMLWCIEHTSGMLGYIPRLHFEGASQEQIFYRRGNVWDGVSVKLQIVPGRWNDDKKTDEIRRIGIWLGSKFMVNDMILALEEGTIMSLCDIATKMTNCNYR